MTIKLQEAQIYTIIIKLHEILLLLLFLPLNVKLKKLRIHAYLDALYEIQNSFKKITFIIDH